MGGHRKRKCASTPSRQIDFYTGEPIPGPDDTPREKKSRHGKKKTELLKEAAAHEKLINSGAPAPGHEESQHDATQMIDRGPKKTSRTKRRR